MALKRKRRRAHRRTKTTEPLEAATATSVQPLAVEGAAPLEPEPLPSLEADGKVDDQAEGSAAESAAVAAALGSDEPSAADGEPGAAPEGPSDFGAPAPALTPDALVQLCEVALYVLVRGACVAKHVPFDDLAQRSAKLAPAERADLRNLAPLATPYLARMMQAAPEWTGVAIFGATFAFTATSHVRAALAPRDHPPPKAKPATATPWVAPGIPREPREE